METLKSQLPNSEVKSLSGMRILIAEDNDSNYLLLTHILKTSILTRAINGEEVVQIAKDGTYDLILMDIKMPILDGYCATRFIREFNKEIPIIALTANAFDSDREKALAEGCNDYVTKPIRKQQLIDIICRWLSL
jgi:CheY-like chemotaxis protein